MPHSLRLLPVAATLLAALIFAGGTALAAGKAKKAEPAAPQAPAESLTPGFAVKASEVVPPEGVPLGQYRRTIQPFPNWTLICDENLSKKQRVCNISQVISGPAGATVFSWSLAATQDGLPFMILRTPPGLGSTGAIDVDLADGSPALSVQAKGCDALLCIAYLPLDKRLRAAMEKGATVKISYVALTAGTVQALSFRVPFAGLTRALAAI